MPLFLNDKLLHNAIAAAVRKYGKNGLVDEIEKLKTRILELENRQNPNVYHPVNEVHVATPQTTVDKITDFIEIDIPLITEEDVPRETKVDSGIKEPGESVISSFPGEPIDSVYTDEPVKIKGTEEAWDNRELGADERYVAKSDLVIDIPKKRGRPKRS